jgi:AmmeMemoRadiSam system protein A
MDPDLCEEAGECGYRSLLIMSGVMNELHYHSKLHSYEGPFGVGYACASFVSLRDPYVALAKLAIRNIVLDHLTMIVPSNTPGRLLNQKAGVFVSIHKHGHLRGCIGTISATTASIAQEIITCAIWAATEDYRFTPITPDQLDHLSIHVDVLGPAEPIDTKEKLDPKRYGVIVSKGARKGLLLPDLQGIDTIDQQISIALQKAGIRDDEAYSLARFEVIRHHD